MPRRLPPLNALRAFEAAARHLSFTRAAQELNVTQAAISHQIKALEENLGISLFRRKNRALVLTDSGRQYFPAVRAAFDNIAQATTQVLDMDSHGVLTVGVLPSFAAKWLVPRLHRFQEQHPEIDVLVSANDRPDEFAREDVDLAIAHGLGSWPGLVAEKIVDDDIAPVCSPRLLSGPHPLRLPEDLRHHTLLHDEQALVDSYATWEIWLQAAGVKGIDPRRGPRFSHTHMAIQAAVDGYGVALGPHVLVASDLAAGRLVCPFNIVLPVSFAYYLVCPEATAERPKVRAFSDWILKEAANP